MTDFEQRYVAARKAVIARDLARLNPMQRQGAMTTEGPLLLLAGAGSGKTTVLIQRVYNLLTYGRGSDCAEVPEDFHARYSCKGKRYVYKIWNAPYMSPFYRGTALHYPRELDADFLDAVCTDFIGKHDFSAFAGAQNTQEDCTREIYCCSVERDDELVTFSVTGDGFLYNMVRIMVGTLLEINEDKIAPDAIPEIIELKDRKNAGRTALPEGLYLDYVIYDEEDE